MASKVGNGKMHDYVPQDAKILSYDEGLAVKRAWSKVLRNWHEANNPDVTNYSWVTFYWDATSVKGIRHIRVTLRNGSLTQAQCDEVMSQLRQAITKIDSQATIKTYTYNKLAYGYWQEGDNQGWDGKPLPHSQQPALLTNNGIRVWYESRCKGPRHNKHIKV